MRISASAIYAGITAALTAAGAAGCVKFSPAAGDGTQDGTPRRIEFPTPIVGTATKSAQSAASYPESSTFGVFGIWYPGSSAFSGWESTAGSVSYIGGSEFFYDGTVDDSTPGSGAWISDPAYCWLPSGKMAFAAWSPFSAGQNADISYGAAGLKIGKFGTGDGRCDLMYAERVCDKTSSAGTSATHDGIDLVFHHALAALRFTVKPAEGVKAKIALTKVAIWGMDGTGDFCENVSEDDPLLYSSSPKWKNTGTAYTEENPLVIPGDGTTAFIIPQKMLKDSGSAVKAKIYYTVQTGEGTPVPAVSSADLSHPVDTATGEAIPEWETGKRYSYTITLGGAIMIRFGVEVGEWGDAAASDTMI